MAQQIINNGSSAGDPTAENIYTAFGKSKSNFAELYNAIATLVLKAGDVMTGVLQFATGTAAAPSAKIGSDQKGFYHEGTNKLGVSVAGVKIGEFNSNGYAGLTNRIVLMDIKTNGTDGGSAIAGDNDRDLTTVVYNAITGASLAANQFILPVGRYYVKKISCPAYSVDAHRAKLYNVTTSAIQTDINSNQIIGSSELAYSLYLGYSNSIIEGYYFDVLTSAKTFKIVHQTQTAVATAGLGLASAFTLPEIYTTVIIEKVG